jgi:two-component system response regulator AtoC
MSKTILFVDDEDTVRTFVSRTLRRDGYEVLEAETLAAARQQLSDHWIDMILLDRMLPDGEGLTLLRELQKGEVKIPVIMLTAHGAIENAVAAMKMGAHDYLTKPVDTEALSARLDVISETIVLRRELEHWRKESGVHDSQWIMGQSPVMRRVAEEMDMVAPTNSTVLITGESGTGKEVVARMIYRKSSRSSNPFRPINCAALPEHLLENELFGHETNAYTGAGKQKKGLLEVADGGTIFLDEISCMKPEMQAKMLRVLQERTVRRVGGTTDIPVDIRILAATNQDLPELMKQGQFRRDLYYRLSVVRIHLPPLRERVEDVPLFVLSFIDYFNRDMGKNIAGISPEALEALKAHDWPGNIRELRNVIERAAVFCSEDQIQLNHLPREILDGA